MTLLLIYVGIAISVSFTCSILEAVLLSVTPAYVGSLQSTSPKLAVALNDLKDDIDRPLVAILMLNTIANTAGAAAAGAQAQLVFGSQWFGAFSAALTFAILVLSEIIPKTLGAVYWRRLAPVATRLLRVLLLPPFGWLVSLVQLLTRALKRNEEPRKVSKEEFTALARLADEQGVFDESESRMIKNIFRFGSLRTRDIMTPRTVMFALPETTVVREVVPQKVFRDGRPDPDTTAQRSTMVFSRIPIYRDDLDHMIGYVLKSELLLHAARDDFERPVGDLVRELMLVPDTLPVATLFERLLDRREHIALVVDEYGGVDGVVTMEDVLETLLGLEIVDEADTAVDLREMARRRWKLRRDRMVVSESRPPPKS